MRHREADFSAKSKEYLCVKPFHNDERNVRSENMTILFVTLTSFDFVVESVGFLTFRIATFSS